MIIRRNAPYIHTDTNTPYIFMNMLIALFPCMIYSVYAYGLRAIALIGCCSCLSLLIARVHDRMKGISDIEYYDISALYSGSMVALLMPPGTGILWAIIAVIFSEIVFKQLFGGVGSNPISNPIAAVLMMNLVFGEKMNGYIEPMKSRFDLSSLLNMATTDTRTDISQLSLYEIVSGTYMGLMGISCTLMILLGFAYLLFKRFVRLDATIAYILIISILVIIDDKINVFTIDGLREYAILMSSSGVLFIAVYALTDMTTIVHGRIVGFITGLFAGLLTFVFMDFTDQIVFLAVPVLFTNIAAFVIEYIASSFYRKRGDLL